MARKKVTVNYNGETLKEDEVLVLMPFDENDVENNVTNKESIVIVKMAGKSTKVVLKAVPKKFKVEAKKQFNLWQREQHPEPTEGRCMIPQPNGKEKECPKKSGNNRVSCAECPNRGKYLRRVVANVSLDAQEDENGFVIGRTPAIDQVLIEKENRTEIQERVTVKFEAMMNKSPKYCLAMLLMGTGCKGEEFASQMHLGHDAANRIRNQILSMAEDGIYKFDQIDVQGFSVNKVGDMEYYRKEAEKTLETLLNMYF